MLHHERREGHITGGVSGAHAALRLALTTRRSSHACAASPCRLLSAQRDPPLAASAGLSHVRLSPAPHPATLCRQAGAACTELQTRAGSPLLHPCYQPVASLGRDRIAVAASDGVWVSGLNADGGWQQHLLCPTTRWTTNEKCALAQLRGTAGVPPAGWGVVFSLCARLVFLHMKGSQLLCSCLTQASAAYARHSTSRSITWSVPTARAEAGRLHMDEHRSGSSSVLRWPSHNAGAVIIVSARSTRFEQLHHDAGSDQLLVLASGLHLGESERSSISSIDLRTGRETSRVLEFLEVYGHCCFHPMGQAASPHTYVAGAVYAGGEPPGPKRRAGSSLPGIRARFHLQPAGQAAWPVRAGTSARTCMQAHAVRTGQCTTQG